jgi:peptidoglycan/xylan/chitin deacetylase (PgdA/CDA1 family)
MKALLTLKIDVDTLRGTREGVPRLARALRDAGVDATFLFSVGPDHTGRALRRAFTPGFLTKVSRTSVIGHYGIKTLLYGTLLPGPHIGRSCANELRAIARDGFEVGLHSYDHVKWQDLVGRRDAAWTAREMKCGIEAFAEIFGTAPKVHGGAGWQMNADAFRLEDELGFDHASDTRGSTPFVARIGGRSIRCPQFPTTLPTLDELIGVDGMDASRAADHILTLTREPAPMGHVFTLHAELEGMKLLPAFLRLMRGWIAQGYDLVSLAALSRRIPRARLRLYEVTTGTVPGRSGTLMTQADSSRERSFGRAKV